MALRIIFSANIIDGHCVLWIVAESDELGEKVIIILGSMFFALVFARYEELIMKVVLVYKSLGFGGDFLAGRILRKDDLVV